MAEGLEAGGVRRHAAGDQQFREHLVAAVPMLRAFARGLIGNRELADDMAQETLLKAWAARASFTPGTNFKAWLYRILRNNYFSVMRTSGRFAPWDPELAERLLVVLPEQGTGRFLADLERSWAQLPAEQREALFLVAAADLSYEEVASIAGCALGTVKSRVSRARSALQKMIDGPEPQDESRPAAEKAGVARGAR